MWKLVYNKRSATNFYIMQPNFVKWTNDTIILEYK